MCGYQFQETTSSVLYLGWIVREVISEAVRASSENDFVCEDLLPSVFQVILAGDYEHDIGEA